MLTPREKSPLPENVPRGGSNPRRCGQRAQTLPTSYSGPISSSERAKQKKTTFLWVLSRLASISVAAVFSAEASALRFVVYLPAATEMCASSALYWI